MSYKNFFKILFILLQNLTIYSIKEQIFNQSINLNIKA